MYIEHPYLSEVSAHLAHCGRDAKGVYLILNQPLLFRVRTTSRPRDYKRSRPLTGVRCVRLVDGEVRHYITDKNPLCIQVAL